MEHVLKIAGFALSVLLVIFFADLLGIVDARWFWEGKASEETEMAPTGEVCTLSTETYPRHEVTVYAAGEGQNQKLRMNHFIIGGGGRQAEYFIVNSGMTYTWNTWNKNPKEGVTFPNAPVSFREY